ncbi:hypothetical protein [Streptomyces alfalfae]|uniref:hypothetical protein n=1 Tax=Streptomyces alfalfae TaxID=1642299 RepID=UPI0013C50B83|nr:hypothetical protein [Streptomyces alfalfae]QUI30979.1 hypothetical protein H9W91_09010 [Streptomyces alfalfae]
MPTAEAAAPAACRNRAEREAGQRAHRREQRGGHDGARRPGSGFLVSARPPLPKGTAR